MGNSQIFVLEEMEIEQCSPVLSMNQEDRWRNLPEGNWPLAQTWFSGFKNSREKTLKK